jgi:hypothetical protein
LALPARRKTQKTTRDDNAEEGNYLRAKSRAQPPKNWEGATSSGGDDVGWHIAQRKKRRGKKK